MACEEFSSYSAEHLLVVSTKECWDALGKQKKKKKKKKKRKTTSMLCNCLFDSRTPNTKMQFHTFSTFFFVSTRLGAHKDPIFFFWLFSEEEALQCYSRDPLLFRPFKKVI